MLRLSLAFLIIALVAAMFGFGIFGLAVEGTLIAAKVLFFLFLILFVASLVVGGRTRKDVV